MPRNPDCGKCPLFTEAKTICLWGQGKTKEPLVFLIGEAPGEVEDKTGIPFHPSAQAGRRLRKLIEMLGAADDCYITNVCKCRPPKNRAPTRIEMETCREYLWEEIRSVRPLYIVLLGASAIRAFTGDYHASVAGYRGRKVWEYEGIPVIATYHPAATLGGRDPAKLELLVEDLNRISKQEFWAPEELKWATVEQVTPSQLGASVAIDLETSGLDPFAPGARIVCASYCSGKRAYVTKNVLDLLQGLRHRTKVLIGHNIKFDLLWLKQHRGFDPKGFEIFDTMVAAHLLDENQPKLDLSTLSSQLTGLGTYWMNDGLDVPALLHKGKIDEVPEKVLHRYNAYDSAAAYRLFVYYKKELRNAGLERLMNLKMAQLKALLNMEAVGFLTDSERIDATEKALLVSLKKQHIALKRKLGEVSPTSPKQLSEFFFDTLQMTPPLRTPKGGGSTSKEALEQLMTQSWHPYQTKLEWQHLTQKQIHNLIGMILRYRGEKKLLSTYIQGSKGVRSCRDAAGRVHASYLLTGAVTGRLSCSRPNIQNIPRGSLIRNFFVAPEGRVLVEADYSQLELRICALITRDARMLELLRAGEDLHAATARLILGHEPSPEEREVAKTCNFMILYGGGVKRLMQEAKIPRREASSFLKGWYATYPGVQAWQKDREKELLSTGQVVNIFDRVRRLGSIVPSDRGAYQAILRQACNSPIQSAASELTLMALVELDRLLGSSTPSVATVHDSILTECLPRQVARISRTQRRVMEDPDSLVRQFGYRLKFDVPFKADVKVGQSWGSMEEVT